MSYKRYFASFPVDYITEHQIDIDVLSIVAFQEIQKAGIPEARNTFTRITMQSGAKFEVAVSKIAVIAALERAWDVDSPGELMRQHEDGQS